MPRALDGPTSGARLLLSLIFDYLVCLAPLDVGATPYDPGRRAPVLERSGPNDRVGRRARREGPPYLALAQVSTKLQEVLRMGRSGQGNQSDWRLYFDFDDLGARGLLEADNTPRIRINDRLVSVHDADTEELIWTVRTPPGLYVVEARPTFGFSAPLLHVTLHDREVTTRK